MRRIVGRMEGWNIGSRPFIPPFQYSIIPLLFLLVSFSGNGQTVVTFNTSGTFIVPCNVTALQVECWGGGGGGGGDNNTSPNISGSGGGGGGYCIASVAVTPGQSIGYTVGIAGAGGAAAAGKGGDGGTTLFLTVNATGGFGGNALNGTPGAGGGGSGGSVTPGMSGQFGNTPAGWSGGGGLAGNQGAGNGLGLSTDVPSNAGVANTGGGGGGAQTLSNPNNAGGAGGSGKIRITYTQSPLSGIYTIGPGGNYASITASIAALTCVAITGPVIFELLPGYTDASETYPITFPVIPGANSVNKIIYRPAAGASNLVCDFAPGTGISLFNFNGGSFITLDGRPGGAGSAQQWTIRNTRIAADIGNVFKYIDGASYDTLKYLNIEGDVTGLWAALINYSGSAAATGNRFHGVSHCKIRDLKVADGGLAAMPFGGIVSVGTLGKENSNITIDQCEFIDIFNPSLVGYGNSFGVLCNVNSTAFTITNNHFYQTSPHAGLNTNAYVPIYLSHGGGHLVSGNYIGGSAPGCGGSPYTITSGDNVYRGIYFGSTTAGAACTITNNLIANITYTTTSTNANSPLTAITLDGPVNYTVGGSAGNGNIIGSTASAGSIILTNNAASGSLGIRGINCIGTGTFTISYNTIGGLTLNGSRAQAGSNLINVSAGTAVIANNLMGNTAADNVNILSNSSFFVINNASGSGMTVSNNTFQNLKHSATTEGFGGINNTAGNLTASGNSFQNITSSSNAGTGAFFMINHQPSGAQACTVSNNTIRNISLTSTGTAVKFYGISINTTANGNACNNNTIGSLSLDNIMLANNAPNYGIYHSLGGDLTCNSNTIREISCTNTGALLALHGIYNAAGAGPITANENTILDLDCSSTLSDYSLTGIRNMAGGSGHVISKNTIQGLTLSPAVVVNSWIAGIKIDAGAGIVVKNYMEGIFNTSTGTGSASACEITGGTDWDVFNNVVFLNGGASSNYSDGIYANGTVNVRTHHNTIWVSGTASGSSASSCLYLSNTGSKTANNNIFLNSRTGGSAQYAVRVDDATSLSINNNFLDVDNNLSQVCEYLFASHTFAQWQSSTGANKDLFGTVSLSGIGVVNTNPFPGAGTGMNVFATVPDDKLDVVRGVAPWMGAYEEQNITTGTISPLSYCGGATVNVPYTLGGSGSFNGGNVFTAQLSDPAGDFTTPTPIGTLASTSSGTITATLPGAISGSGYRIRVISSDPIITGSDNGADINIQTGTPGAPVATPAGALSCSGFTANWNASAGTINYYLDVATDPGITAFVAGYNDLNVGGAISYAVTGLLAGTNYYYRVRAENGCGTSANSNIIGPVLTAGTPQTYTVTNTANTGAGSLRQAILDANANCGHDLIKFNLGAGGPFTIALTAALPNLSDVNGAGVTIDGWDNSGNNGTPNSIPVFNTTVGTPMNPTYKIIITNSATNGGINIADSYNIIRGLAFYNIGGATSVATDIAINILSGSNNSILGCYVGMNVNGVAKGGANTDIGIQVSGSNNFIGDGTAAGANLISGLNGSLNGILFTGAGATGNSVRGNMIGLQANGTNTVSASAQEDGIKFNAGAGGSNIIGGVVAGEGNVISGNNGSGTGYGITMGATPGTGNTIAGNIIGPQANGTAVVAGNTQVDGIFMVSANNHTIGGNTAGARNIISANNTEGIYMSGAGTTSNVIKGNYIGIDKTGAAFITSSTQDKGITIASSCGGNNSIGGSGANEGNVISGNYNDAGDSYGIYLNSSAVSGNTVLGNIIGPRADGLNPLPAGLQSNGVYLTNSQNNIIGGNTAGARNIISANEIAGVYITGAGSTGNTIKGNYIGTNINGIGAFSPSYQDNGIIIDISAGSNTVGGTGLDEGNLISGNSSAGIYLNSSAAAGNVVVGNIIGSQSNGNTYLPSNPQQTGIYIGSSPNNTVGGNTVAARNIISANELHGVYITGASSTGNVVKGNYIGIDKNGTTFIASSTQDYGVYVTSSAGSNTIGGTGANEGNVISGNKNATSSGTGVYLNSATGNVVVGNIIGPQADGITYVTSNAQNSGVEIINSSGNIVGGNTSPARNILSGNLTSGVFMSGASSTGNSIKGNYLGPSSSLTAIVGSDQNYGVFGQAGAANNIIGSTAAGEGNLIAFNSAEGVRLFSLTTTGNKISGNPIYSNTGKPINLNYGGSQANTGKAFPVITSVTGTTVSGTSGAADVIEVFKNTTTNCFDATTYLGTTTAVAGSWSLTGLGLVAGDYVLATATDASNNTSEFSGCVTLTANTIATDAVTPTTLCRGGSLSVTYTTTGTFGPGNVFTAELSTSTGTFPGTDIGNITADVATPIPATIPLGATPAGVYRIRVRSSIPVLSGTDNGANLTVPSDGGAGPFTWTGTVSTSWFDRCNWDLKALPDSWSDVIIPGGTPFQPTITGAAASCNTINVISSAGAILTIQSTLGGSLTITQ